MSKIDTIKGGTFMEVLLQMTEKIETEPALNDFTKVQSMLTSVMTQDARFQMAEITALVEKVQEDRKLRHFHKNPDQIEESGYSLVNDFMAVLNYVNQDKGLKKKVAQDPSFISMVALILLTSGSVYIHQALENVFTVEELAKNNNGRPVLDKSHKVAMLQQFEALLNLTV
jgi:hypothetical protein